jgi:periplasmic protein TonB
MFENTFVGHGASRRSWPVVVSFLAQSLLVCLAALIPLLTTRSLPAQQWFAVLLEPPRPPAPAAPPAAEPQPRQTAPTRIDDSVFHSPAVIPEKVALITDPEQPIAQAPQDVGLRVVGAVPGGDPNSLFSGGRAPVIAPPPPPVVTPKQPVTPQPVIVSSTVQEAKLVQRVVPVYPPLARQARISGTVRLQAIIGVDGAIRELRVLSGHPLLVRNALDAVQQWRYRPTELNNQPVEVLTQIEVNYTLR